MAKTGLAGKSNKYGNSIKKKGGKDGTPKASSKSKPKFKNKTQHKALVPKEVLEALKQNKEEKNALRQKNFEAKKAGKKMYTKDGKMINKKPFKKEEKKEELDQKSRKKMRKEQAVGTESYENITAIKKLWGVARIHDMDAAKRVGVIKEMKALMVGHVKDLMFKHDLARVVQTILKFGRSEHGGFIIEELTPEVVDLAKSKYGKFIVNRMLKYSSAEQRKLIFKEMCGNFKKMTLHADAVNVVDTFYNDYANSYERTAIITEFYGKEFYLFRDLLSEHLSKVLEVHPDKKEIIMGNLLKLTNTFIEKALTKNIVVQHLILQYVLHATEVQIQELLSDKLIEQLVDMIHTKEGAGIAMRCIWFGKTKDRKMILKSLKGHVKEISNNEHGYLVLCAIFDCVDDTVLVKKSILSELIESLEFIVINPHGRRVVEYLLSPRNSKTFHPLIVDVLKIGDANTTSKKDPAVRHTELLTHFSAPLIASCAENTESLSFDNSATLTLCAAAVGATCDVKPLLQSIACLAEPAFDEDHLVNKTNGHVIFRNLLQHEKTKQDFSDILVVGHIGVDKVCTWVTTNRGAFTVLRILEAGVCAGQDQLIQRLKSMDLASIPTCAGIEKLKEFLSSH